MAFRLCKDTSGLIIWYMFTETRTCSLSCGKIFKIFWRHWSRMSLKIGWDFWKIWPSVVMHLINHHSRIMNLNWFGPGHGAAAGKSEGLISCGDMTRFDTKNTKQIFQSVFRNLSDDLMMENIMKSGTCNPTLQSWYTQSWRISSFSSKIISRQRCSK